MSCRSLFYLVVILAIWVVGHLGACSPAPGSLCEEGQEVTCSCANNGLGIQRCVNGMWGACEQCRPTQQTDCSKPGEIRVCTCTDQRQGQQTCLDSGKWQDCHCEGTNPTCVKGERRHCTCPNQTSGEQVCGDGGAWGTCQCSACVDGTVRECMCADNSLGKQTCRNGLWETCGSCKEPPPECKTNEVEFCYCPNGARSRRRCQDNGRWGDCECGSPTCTIGQKQEAPCYCANGIQSERYCVQGSNGPEWGPCLCSCKLGETRPCDCPNAQQGVHTCKCDKNPCEWSACQCPLCEKDDDCSHLPTTKLCNLRERQCVECLETSHCKDPKRPLCSSSSAACVECLQDNDCQGGNLCDPISYICRQFERGSLAGKVSRCHEGKPRPAGCAGSPRIGDDKGPLYFMFFSGKDLPPKYSEKPFLVHKIPNVDFSDNDTTIPYKIDNIPVGRWLVYVFLDDNNNWSSFQHMPDRGDLVGFLNDIEIKANATTNINFFLFDRY